jgi:ribosomal protein S18 acetylase RimI-like enzyme
MEGYYTFREKKNSGDDQTESSITVIDIRQINTGEGKLYRQLRLASLAESPDLFSTTYSEAIKRDICSWDEQADSGTQGSDRITMIAFNDSQPVGIGSVYRDSKNEFYGELIQFWIESAYRGREVAPELIRLLISWSVHQNYRKLIAWVNCGNLRAVKFYQKHGFIMTDQTKPLRMKSGKLSCLMELML